MGSLRRISYHRAPQHRGCVRTGQRAVHDRRDGAQRCAAQRSKQSTPQSGDIHLPGGPAGRAEASGPVSPPAAKPASPHRLRHAVLRFGGSMLQLDGLVLGAWLVRRG